MNQNHFKDMEGVKKVNPYEKMIIEHDGKQFVSVSFFVDQLNAFESNLDLWKKRWQIGIIFSVCVSIAAVAVAVLI